MNRPRPTVDDFVSFPSPAPVGAAVLLEYVPGPDGRAPGHLLLDSQPGGFVYSPAPRALAFPWSEAAVRRAWTLYGRYLVDRAERGLDGLTMLRPTRLGRASRVVSIPAEKWEGVLKLSRYVVDGGM
jgi:hypothetical protein